MRKNKISLVVLNYNGLSHLKEYFDSVFGQSVIPDEIIMFDNLSRDGSREFVRKNYPKVKIIVEDSYNTGTATGSNIGFRHTSGDYIIFQSNDIKLHKNCVKELINILDNNPKVGIATSVLLNYYKDKKTGEPASTQRGEHLIDNAGGIADIFGFGMQNYPQKKCADIPESGEVFFSYGGSFIIRSKLFEKVGGFDDRYFTLNDDFDLSWRVRLLGYKVMYTKKSIVYHKVSATLGKRNWGVKHYWSQRNLMRTFLKNASNLHLLLICPLYWILFFAQVLYFFARGKFSLAFANLKAFFWNLLYLPETLVLRYRIQSQKRKNNIAQVIIFANLKLKFFREFHKAL
jgi:GT2 family glycosyltransferase